MALHTPAKHSSPGQINDRIAPRWRVNSIACTLLSGEQWHPVAVLDISLGGVKVRGRWDYALPVTAVSLGDDGRTITGTFLTLQAESVWTDQARGVTALRFDIPNPVVAANLLKFLASHIASGPSRCCLGA